MGLRADRFGVVTFLTLQNFPFSPTTRRCGMARGAHIQDKLLKIQLYCAQETQNFLKHVKAPVAAVRGFCVCSSLESRRRYSDSTIWNLCKRLRVL